MRLVGVGFPFEYEPKHDCGECRGISVDLALNGTEPERVAESVYQCAHHCRCFYGNQLGHGDYFVSADKQAACEVGYGPEQEQYSCGRQQCAHGVDHACHLRWVACKMREQIGREHEERRSGRVSDFEFVACGDELRTVPKAGCRLNRGAVDKRGNGKGKPSEDVVHKSKLFHLVLGYCTMLVSVCVQR